MKLLMQFTLALAFALAFVACGDSVVETSEPIDVVHDIEPVDNRLRGSVSMEDLADMSPADRREYINRRHPNLEAEVIYSMRVEGKVDWNERPQRVDFYFGSLSDVIAESGDGRLYEGKFENELIAAAHFEGRDNPVMVFVDCLNGMIEDPERIAAELSRVAEISFLIRPEQGLRHHANLDDAIDIAEVCGVPLYEDREMRNRITPDQARELSGLEATRNLTVLVHPGDRFYKQDGLIRCRNA